MLRRLRRGLFWLSRTAPMGMVVRLAFGWLWWLLPVRRVAQTPGVLAFEHPAPTWQPHILLVPKRAIRSLVAARPEDGPLFGQIVRLGLALAQWRDLAQAGFALLVNGGAYQDVPQLHVHLAGLDDGLRYSTPEVWPERARAGDAGAPLIAGPLFAAYRHPQPAREIHAIVLPTEPLSWSDLAGPRGEEIGRALLPFAQRLVPALEIGDAGFTLLASVRAGGLHDAAVFHLVGGGDLREEQPA